MSLLTSWVSAGQPAELFWRVTLREADAIFAGARLAAEARHKEIAWGVWHTEALARSKKMPPLSDLIGVDKPKPRIKTPKELSAIAMQWHLAILKRNGK